MSSTCKVQDATLSKMLDIQRGIGQMLKRCDASVNTGDPTGQNNVECGRDTVVCPCCHMDAGVCANHLMLDEEYHPQFEQGVCADCFMNPDACPSSNEVKRVRIVPIVQGPNRGDYKVVEEG